MEFIQINNNIKYNSEPYILIDTSGSTNDKCKITQEKKQTILEAEIAIIKNILFENNITKSSLILWSDEVKSFPNIDIMEFFKENTIESNGGTYLEKPLNTVFSNIVLNKESGKDVIILTDGEINDSDKIAKPLADLFSENVNLYILTFENNNNNYYSENCGASNKLYKYLNSNGKMHFVKKIIQYNNNHKTGFTSLNNFDVPVGYLPFREEIFLISDFSKFINILKKEIEETKENNVLLKLTHELSRTLFYISKDKESNIRQMLVNNISEHFKNTEIYSQVRELLMNEIDNHINHKSTTFQDYRGKRNDLFERSQINLMANTCKSITYNHTNEYISFPIKTTDGTYIFECDHLFVNQTMNIGKLEFKNSCFELNNYVIPVFPANIILNEEKDQCLRQWIRAIYSKNHHVKIISDKILYLVLIDLLKIHLSDNISVDIKKHYTQLAKVMLNAKTYGTNTEIIKELYNKNKLSRYDFFEYYLNTNNIDITSGCVWYGILLCLADKKLIEFQEHIYKNDLIKYAFENDDDLMLMLKNKFNSDWKEKKIKQKYTFPEHDIINGIKCTNSYAIEETEEYIKCACGEKINIDKIIFNNNDTHAIKIDNQIYHKNICQDIKLNWDDNNDLLKIDDLNFNIGAYNIKNIIMTDILSNIQVVIKTKSEFIEKVNKLYPFMKNLDMSNVCLAGGFVRSVLLCQKMKDFDFFLFGCDNYLERTKKLIGDLVTSVKQANPDDDKHKFLYIYKPLFNVFEIVYVSDPTNHFTDKFDIKNFSQYKYLSLRRYETGNIENDENFFEDNDSKGIRIKHRFQFVMCKFDSISHIFESFDMGPSCVAFDGNDVYFNKNSHDSYKYMVNVISNNRWTDLYDSRISKYLSYGFDIVFDEKDVKNMEFFNNNFINSNSVSLGSLNFEIRKMESNKIIIKHDSHKKELYDIINEFEKNA